MVTKRFVRSRSAPSMRSKGYSANRLIGKDILLNCMNAFANALYPPVLEYFLFRVYLYSIF